MEINYQHHCFVCGEKNQAGLKLKFSHAEDKVWTTYIPSAAYEGYPGILHGGITSTLLDEVMSQCLHVQGLAGLTARLEVRFKQSIPIGKPVIFEARMIKRKGTLVDLEAKALLEDGQLAATALGRFMLIEMGVIE